MHPTEKISGFELVSAGSVSKKEICDMIADAQLFADFDWKDVEAMADYVHCCRVAAGSVLFKEGDPGSYMCLLISGQVEILKNDRNDKPQNMVAINPGKTVGEMSIIDGEPRSGTCIASRDSVLLLLTKDNYGRIIKERPVLAVHIVAKLAKLMSQRLRGVSGQLVEYLG
jgi:CRP/FNR family cyclic AMP-dependent transcriptional regulator